MTNEEWNDICDEVIKRDKDTLSAESEVIDGKLEIPIYPLAATIARELKARLGEPSGDLSAEILKFAQDFYPSSDHDSRLEHLNAEVQEVNESSSWEEEYEELCDVCLIAFHQMLVVSPESNPLNALLGKLNYARQRIESGEKNPRDFKKPEPSGDSAALIAEGKKQAELLINFPISKRVMGELATALEKAEKSSIKLAVEMVEKQNIDSHMELVKELIETRERAEKSEESRDTWMRSQIQTSKESAKQFERAEKAEADNAALREILDRA